MSPETLVLLAGVAVVVIAAAAVTVAWSVWHLARDAGEVVRAQARLADRLESDLPRTLDAVERAAAGVEALAGESGARLVRADALATEAEATLVALRELCESARELVRGPADTVSGMRRSARVVGESLASGADRLRRAVTRSDIEQDE